MSINDQPAMITKVVGTTLGLYGAIILDEKALMPVGIVVAFIGVVWWAGRKLAFFENTIKHHTTALNQGTAIMAKQTKAIREIQVTMMLLPCAKNGKLKCDAPEVAEAEPIDDGMTA